MLPTGTRWTRALCRPGTTRPSWASSFTGASSPCRAMAVEKRAKEPANGSGGTGKAPRSHGQWISWRKTTSPRSPIPTLPRSSRPSCIRLNNGLPSYRALELSMSASMSCYMLSPSPPSLSLPLSLSRNRTLIVCNTKTHREV